MKVYAWRIILAENGLLELAPRALGLSGPATRSTGTWLVFTLHLAAVHDPADLRGARTDPAVAARGLGRPRRPERDDVPSASCCRSRSRRSSPGSIFTFSLTLGDYITPHWSREHAVHRQRRLRNIGVANNLPFAAAYAIVPVVVMVVYLLARAPRSGRSRTSVVVGRRRSRACCCGSCGRDRVVLAVPLLPARDHRALRLQREARPVVADRELDARSGSARRSANGRSATRSSSRSGRGSSRRSSRSISGRALSLAVHRYRFFGRADDLVPRRPADRAARDRHGHGAQRHDRHGLEPFGIGFGLLTIVVGHATFCVVVVYNNVVARLRRSRLDRGGVVDLGARHAGRRSAT